MHIHDTQFARAVTGAVNNSQKPDHAHTLAYPHRKHLYAPVAKLLIHRVARAEALIP